MKYPELKGICKECKYKCGRVENPLFTGVEKCEYATVEQINFHQIMINDLKDKK